MDRKTKQRILGVLVVIGLIIILLPFLQNEKGLPTETTVLKAPPFPDQAVQVTSSIPTSKTFESRGSLNTSTQAGNAINQQPDDTISVVRPSVINAKAPEMAGEIPSTRVNPKSDNEINPPIESDESKAIELPAAKAPDQDIKTQLIDAEEIVNTDTAPKKLQKSLKVVQQGLNDPASKIKPFKPTIKPFIPESTYAHKSSAKFTSSDKTTFDKDGLAKLQDAAWVIQIGSFKNKANALRLVNQLRANGYKAFIQQISTSFGDSTRVFVGPESKHTAARALASRLENDLHIHGIVISYKPLAL